jgi:hypothetical protein
MPNGDNETPPYPGMVKKDGPKGFGWYKQVPKSLYEKATTPLVSPETILKGTPYESEKASAEKAIQSGEQRTSLPFGLDFGLGTKAGRATFGAGVDKSMSDLMSSFTSPASLAMMAASGGESALGKGLAKTMLKAFGGVGAGLFGVQGAKQAATGRQPGEDLPSEIERRLMGASAATGAAAGAGALSRDALHSVLRRSLKLDEDLATKVADRVAKGQKARTEAAAGKAARKADITSLQDLKMKKGGELLADMQTALIQEQARVSKPFHDIGEQIKQPVAASGEVRNIVQDAVKEIGGNPNEIPGSAFKAFPEEKSGSINVAGKKLNISEMSPQQIANFKRAGLDVSDAGINDLSFNDLTRIRDDLGKAAKAHADPTIKRGLFEARKKISAIQEQAAEDAGLGKKYTKAKQDYEKFKRGMGSDLITDWLDASDVKEEQIGPKVRQLFNPATSEALRTILKSAGLDVGPLDRIVEEKGELKEVHKTARAQERAAISKAESTKDIIPGTKAGELYGRSNESLLRDRLESQANSMREAGIREPFALMQYAVGILQLARGSMFGSFHLSRGLAMTMLPEKIKSPAFQDWVMDKAGIEDRTLTKKITDSLYKAVRKSMTSGVQEQATSKAGQD